MKPLELIAGAARDLQEFMEKRLHSSDLRLKKSATLIAYWIRDYIRLLNMESSRNKKYRRYHRGDVVKVHLGFRIGNEEGGLHYGIVLDKFDGAKSSIVTILPMTSIKPKTDLKHLNFRDVYLGTDITDAIADKLMNDARSSLASYLAVQEQLTELQHKNELTEEAASSLAEKAARARKKNDIVQKQMLLAAKMKRGGIALCNQIVTVSKLRIYGPCSKNDLLYGTCLSDESMKIIDGKIKELYLEY